MVNRHIREEKYNGTYNTNKYMKICGHILFEMAGSNFGPECRYLRCMDLNVYKTKNVLLTTHMVMLVDHGVYIEILGHEHRNT